MARTGRLHGHVEGALLAVFAAFFALAAHYVPLLGLAAALAAPIPLTIAILRHGLRTGLLAGGLSAALAVLIGGPLPGASVVLGFGPIGLVIGLGIRRRLSVASILTLTTAVALVSLLLSLLVGIVATGIDPRIVIRDVLEQTRRSQQDAIQLYRRLGIDTRQIAQASATMDQVLALAPQILGAMLVILAGVVAVTNYGVTRLVLKRLGVVAPPIPSPVHWRVHPSLMWVYVAGMAFLWIAARRVGPPNLPLATVRQLPPEDLWLIVRTSPSRFPVFEAVGTNLLYLGQFVFVGMGLIAAWVLLERYGAPRWLRWMAITFAFTSPQLAIAVFLLGLADAGFDLRSRWRAAKTAEASM